MAFKERKKSISTPSRVRNTVPFKVVSRMAARGIVGVQESHVVGISMCQKKNIKPLVILWSNSVVPAGSFAYTAKNRRRKESQPVVSSPIRYQAMFPHSGSREFRVPKQKQNKGPQCSGGEIYTAVARGRASPS